MSGLQSILKLTCGLVVMVGGGARAVAATEEGGAVEKQAAVEQAAPVVELPRLKVGGALRFNAFLKSWERNAEGLRRPGAAFDTFRLNLDGSYRGLSLSAEYRLYAGYHMLHHGYVGYAFSDAVEVRAGVQQAPFGLSPYASHNWFFGLPYYVGLEDDYDLGVVAKLKPGPFDLDVAFFASDEGNYSGGSRDSSRFSYDPVLVDEGDVAGLDGPRGDKEGNRLDARLTRTFTFGEEANLELGVSGRLGLVENRLTNETGTNWAAAAHLSGNWNGLNVQLEAIRYAWNLAGPEAQDGRYLVMGAYDAPYKVASRGTILVANVAWRWDVAWGPISAITLYNDFSTLLKAEDGYANSMQNVTGFMVSAGPVYAYFDQAAGKNHPWLGGPWGSALAEGVAEAKWSARYNINLGYYF